MIDHPDMTGSGMNPPNVFRKGVDSMIKEKIVAYEEPTKDVSIMDIPGGQVDRVDISKEASTVSHFDMPKEQLTEKRVSPNTKAVIDDYVETLPSHLGTADKYSTGIKQKRENFQAFYELIRNQFDHGGDKYATKASGKEFTDLICEAFPGDSGVDWVLGTCMKYLGRYKNFRREKDLLKVATYMYLLWLKGGFHLSSIHDEDTTTSGAGEGCNTANNKLLIGSDIGRG